MNLAKPRVDFGLNTNNLEPMLAFWHGEVGLPFEHVLPIRPGMAQHRHDALGSVIKINHHADPLPERPAGGYVELLLARDGLAAPMQLRDPDGNLVSLVPKGHLCIGQIGIRLNVRNIAAHRRFYIGALGLTEQSVEQGAAFRAGETLILIDETADAPSDAGMDGKGWRYMTFQVFKCDDEHAHALKHGAREALAPVTLGGIARISMIRDPDGNWIELSQRGNLTGSLE